MTKSLREGQDLITRQTWRVVAFTLTSSLLSAQLSYQASQPLRYFPPWPRSFEQDGADEGSSAFSRLEAHNRRGKVPELRGRLFSHTASHAGHPEGSVLAVVPPGLDHLQFSAHSFPGDCCPWGFVRGSYQLSPPACQLNPFTFLPTIKMLVESLLSGHSLSRKGFNQNSDSTNLLARGRSNTPDRRPDKLGSI